MYVLFSSSTIIMVSLEIISFAKNNRIIEMKNKKIDTTNSIKKKISFISSFISIYIYKNFFIKKIN